MSSNCSPVPTEDRLRFSDVVRELGLTQATAHAILATLCDRGWVSRDPVDKTYSLGPALAVVATRVETARPMAHSAPERRRSILPTNSVMPLRLSNESAIRW